MIFENLHLSVYYFISTVKRFMEPVCCHKLKRKILLEMVKTVVQASLCGEGIVKTWKYYSYSIQIPPRTLLLKAFLWFSLIHLQSGLKKALLTSSQRTTVEELFLDRYFGLVLHVDKPQVIPFLGILPNVTSSTTMLQYFGNYLVDRSRYSAFQGL